MCFSSSSAPPPPMKNKINKKHLTSKRIEYLEYSWATIILYVLLILASLLFFQEITLPLILFVVLLLLLFSKKPQKIVIYQDKFFKYLKLFGLLLLGLGLIYLMLNFIFPNEVHYAWESVRLNCEVAPQLIYENNFSNENMILAGSAGFYNSKNSSIVILNEDEYFVEKILKHEKCHQSQIFNFPCSFRLGVFITEFECYIKENE